MKLRADTIFYKIGLIIWLPVLFAGSWFAKTGFAKFGNEFTCVLYEWSGIMCPGCGGTRAVLQLFSGNIIKSFFYHPAVIIAILCYFHFMICYTYRNIIKRNFPGKEIRIELYAYILAAVIILQWIIKLFYMIF